MSVKIYSHCISTSNRLKMIAISKLKAELDKTAAEEEKLKKELLRVAMLKADDRIKEYINDHLLLDKLFDMGYYEDKIVYEHEYDFEDERDVKKAFRQLQKIWSNAIEVKYFPDGNHRVRITIIPTQ